MLSRCNAVQMQHCAGAMLFRCNAVQILCCSDANTVQALCCSGATLFGCNTVQMQYCAGTVLFRCNAVQMQHSAGAALFRCNAVQMQFPLQSPPCCCTALPSDSDAWSTACTEDPADIADMGSSRAELTLEWHREALRQSSEQRFPFATERSHPKLWLPQLCAWAEVWVHC